MGQFLPFFSDFYFGARHKWQRLKLRRAHKRCIKTSLRELRAMDYGLGNGWDILASTVIVNVSVTTATAVCVVVCSRSLATRRFTTCL